VIGAYAGDANGTGSGSAYHYDFTLGPVSIDNLLQVAKMPPDNHPNPFNPSTTISYSVAADRHVSLVIYNIFGQRVRRLVNRVQSAGHHIIVALTIWDVQWPAGPISIGSLRRNGH